VINKVIFKDLKHYTEIPDKWKFVESVLMYEKALETCVQFAGDEADSEQLLSD